MLTDDAVPRKFYLKFKIITQNIVASNTTTNMWLNLEKIFIYVLKSFLPMLIWKSQFL